MADARRSADSHDALVNGCPATAPSSSRPAETDPTADVRCRAGVPDCECDYHSPEWVAYAAEYGIVLPSCDETCCHHPDNGEAGHG